MPRTSLRPHPSSAGAARRFVADVLLNRGFADDCIERTTLLTSEVVTSAVVRMGGIELVVMADYPMARVEVHDDDTSFSRDPEPDEATNLRLKLIDAFSEAWAVEKVGGRGSRTWFEVRA